MLTQFLAVSFVAFVNLVSYKKFKSKEKMPEISGNVEDTSTQRQKNTGRS